MKRSPRWWGVPWLLMGAVCTACPRSTPAPTTAPDAASAARAALPPLKDVDESVPGVTLLPAKVWAAQIKATPEETEARALAETLTRNGVVAKAHRADLGTKGIWYRVTVGDWPRRDLLDARAPELVASKAVAPVVGPPPTGEPAFVPLQITRVREFGAPLRNALHKLVPAGATASPDGGTPTVTAHLAPGGDGVVRAFVTGAVEGKVLVLDHAGAQLEAVSVPKPDCAGCDVVDGPAQVELGWDLAGSAEPELLLRVGRDEAHALVLLSRGAQGYAPVLSVVGRLEDEHQITLGEITLRQLDSDPDLEVLWTGARLTFLEGQSVCSATPLALAFDPGPKGGRPMDERLHAANGVARHQGGADEIRAFLRGTWDRAPDLALSAALAYLAEAPDDAEIYRDVVSRAEAAAKEGRRGFQLRALLGLLAARSEWRAGLAPRLHELIPAVVKQARTLEGKGCDQAPLLLGPAAQKARTDPREALAAAARRSDPAQLPAPVLASLLGAFPQGSPLAEDVNTLMTLLEERAPQLVNEARTLDQARRAGGQREVGPTVPAVRPSGTPVKPPPAEPEPEDEEPTP
ncbi:MAG: SPOR domain-containing protein [Myxococcota bacterium]